MEDMTENIIIYFFHFCVNYIFKFHCTVHSHKHNVVRKIEQHFLIFSYLSPGTYAVMSVMIGSVTERLAPDSDFTFPGNETNSTFIDFSSRDAERVKIAATVTFLSGIFQVGFLSLKYAQL